MASINKLSVRGVRSFSPEDSEQVIEFFCPLTIIVGANGCGKTTIIEALKYAITGSLPPDSRKGQSFVHDARSIGQQQVKASVKLRFTSKSEQSMVVVRSMELTQKKTTISFKQLDGVLRTLDPRTGERESLSHKCTELDTIVPQCMGVSKAILEHVLFCHQEDSSWPLMDSASLKKRFDDIFDSARYAKAIDVFKKKEKAYNSAAKDLRTDLAGLQSHKHAAKGFQKELDEQNEILEEIDETKDKLKKQMEQVDGLIAKYQAIVDETDAVSQEIKAKEDELDREKAVIGKQREMIQEDLTKTHSMEQLKAKLRDFDRTMETQRQQLQELEDERAQILRVMASLRQQEMQLSNDATKYELAKQGHETNLRRRYALLESIARNHSLDLALSQTQADQSFTASVTAASITCDMGTQESVISIASEDMQSFFEALNKKEQELLAKMDAHKRRTKDADDELQEVIQELSGKIKVVQNDVEKLRTKKEELLAEQTELSKQVPSHSRLRKSDVEDARKKAAVLGKQRDDANNDPRRKDIATEIRSLEDKIDNLKRRIEDDRILRDSLRMSAEAQNSIALLEEQCVKDVEGVEEALRDHASTFQKFNIPLIESLPKEDENGEEIVKAVGELKDSIQAKFDESHAELSSEMEELTRTQRSLSEKSALMTSSQQSLASLKPKLVLLNGSVEQAKQVAQDLRRHDAALGLVVRVNEETPKELLAYLDERLGSIEDDSPVEISLQAMKKLAKRLNKMATIPNDNDDGGFRVQCPCCKRDFDNDSKSPSFTKDVKVFQNNMKFLSSEESPLLTIDARYQEMKANYEGWKKTIQECMDDLRDYQRMSQEMKDVENEHQRLLEDIAHYQSKLRKQQSDLEERKSSDDELRDLAERSKRWLEEAMRVAEKRMQIAQTNLDLTATVGDTGRDLKTVERDLNRMLEEKDEYGNKINNLNRETTQINTTITNLSGQANRMEQIARDKEEKYANEQKSSERKAEVVEQLQTIALEETKLRNQIAPLEKKLAGKKEEKEKARALYEEEGDALSNEISAFTSEVQDLRALANVIEKYESSNKPREQEKVAEKAASVQAQIAERHKHMEALQPRIDEMKSTVNDQERHKNLLTQNMDMLRSKSLVNELNKEVEVLNDRRSQIEGGDTAAALYAEAKQKKSEMQEKKYRTEGRFSEVVEQIRSLKRKLMAPEYRDVEEQYRIAMIKYETTQLAAQDLKKYYTAIDKALLQFHGRKIEDINRIIRELWMMTYKGGDITNIEIVSGQEPGSKAAKSYNYRVVMTKGSSRLDMKGRCSAGQRVLASMVIRLALAETFGVNCGCIALDEPTVNLDYRNKKGLGVALAQIVANRATQKNFQLVLITHDEEFVALMKTELSSLTGFSMPEKYFQVRREQGIDGKYYSKIDAVDWNEMV